MNIKDLKLSIYNAGAENFCHVYGIGECNNSLFGQGHIHKVTESLDKTTGSEVT